MAQWCNLLLCNSAWGSVLALFYFKTKSPKDITIRPVEGRDVVSELTECANAGEPAMVVFAIYSFINSLVEIDIFQT
jgi:hypothetical protein